MNSPPFVGVQAEERKWQSAPDFGQLLEDRLFTLITHPTAEHPAGSHVHRAQGEEELPSAGRPAMSHQIDLQEPRPSVIPIGEGFDGTWLRKSEPGRVRDRPRPPGSARYGANRRSMVAGLLSATRSTSPRVRSAR